MGGGHESAVVAALQVVDMRLGTCPGGVSWELAQQCATLFGKANEQQLPTLYRWN